MNAMRSIRLWAVGFLAAVLLVSSAAVAQQDSEPAKEQTPADGQQADQPARQRPARPGRAQPARPGAQAARPDFANVAYGPHERNVLDFWKARSDAPTPVVIYIHGGGFRFGDKQSVSKGLLAGCLASGISVASINYRLPSIAPFPAPMHDSVRAVQFIRSKAAEWNVDTKRLACTGGSAGAGISLWIGFHDDMADPRSDDPVQRQSSRISCMVVNGAQCTYDPRAIKEIVGGRAHEHPALLPFFDVKSVGDNSPEAVKRYEAASPINYLTRDDPPVLATYGRDDPDDTKAGKGIHSVKFGVHLKKKMDALGIECIVTGPGIGQEMRGKVSAVEFFRRHFGMTADKPAAGRPGEKKEVTVPPPADGASKEPDGGK